MFISVYLRLILPLLKGDPMLPNPAPPTTPRQRSFYARRFSPLEKRGLRRLDPLDLLGEIELLRVQSLRFTRDVTAIASVARAQALLHRSGGSLTDEIQRALEAVDPYLTDED